MNKTMFEDIRPSTPLHTAVSNDTVETRGQRALAMLNGSSLYRDEHALFGDLIAAKNKIDQQVLFGREIESLTIGESIALYFEAFERQAHEDYMADLITHRQYSTRITRLRNKIIG